MNRPRIATVMDAATVTLSTVGYFGIALLASTLTMTGHTCATTFIGRVTIGAITALGFSGAAVALYGLRRWLFAAVPLRSRLLPIAAAPLISTATFLVLVSGALLLDGRMH